MLRSRWERHHSQMSSYPCKSIRFWYTITEILPFSYLSPRSCTRGPCVAPQGPLPSSYFSAKISPLASWRGAAGRHDMRKPGRCSVEPRGLQENKLMNTATDVLGCV